MVRGGVSDSGIGVGSSPRENGSAVDDEVAPPTTRHRSARHSEAHEREGRLHMAEELPADWPGFTIMTYRAPTGIPHGWDAELLEKGAPDGLAYTPARELTLMGHPEAGPLVCFGTTGLYAYICLDPHTKQVVGVNYGAFRPGDPQPHFAGPAWFVNSSLDHFSASVRAVTERFPFDSDVTGKDSRGEEDEDARDDRRFNEWEQAVLELAEILGRIDPAVSTLGGQFWGDFLADVGMGNHVSDWWINPPDY